MLAAKHGWQSVVSPASEFQELDASKNHGFAFQAMDAVGAGRFLHVLLDGLHRAAVELVVPGLIGDG